MMFHVKDRFLKQKEIMLYEGLFLHFKPLVISVPENYPLLQPHQTVCSAVLCLPAFRQHSHSLSFPKLVNFKDYDQRHSSLRNISISRHLPFIIICINISIKL